MVVIEAGRVRDELDKPYWPTRICRKAAALLRRRSQHVLAAADSLPLKLLEDLEAADVGHWDAVTRSRAVGAVTATVRCWLAEAPRFLVTQAASADGPALDRRGVAPESKEALSWPQSIVHPAELNARPWAPMPMLAPDVAAYLCQLARRAGAGDLTLSYCPDAAFPIEMLVERNPQTVQHALDQASLPLRRPGTLTLPPANLICVRQGKALNLREEASLVPHSPSNA